MEVSKLTVDVLHLVNLYIHLKTTVMEGLTICQFNTLSQDSTPTAAASVMDAAEITSVT